MNNLRKLIQEQIKSIITELTNDYITDYNKAIQIKKSGATMVTTSVCGEELADGRLEVPIDEFIKYCKERLKGHLITTKQDINQHHNLPDEFRAVDPMRMAAVWN